MRSGYRILWTDHALEELEKAVEYLQLNFTDAEIARLAKGIESTLGHISLYPLMYPESAQTIGVRRAIVLRFNTLYYRVNDEEAQIEILSFFSNRQNPERNPF